MEPSTLAGIITAAATVITACGGVILAISVLIPILRQTRQIHTIVNQQRTDMERYQRALVAVLKEHGIDVPIDQSIDPNE